MRLITHFKIVQKIKIVITIITGKAVMKMRREYIGAQSCEYIMQSIENTSSVLRPTASGAL